MMFRKTNKNFITLTYLFFLLCTGVAVFLNLNVSGKQHRNAGFVQVELKSGLSQETISGVETFILGSKVAKQVRYFSREESMDRVIKELELDVKEITNPLNDILIVNVAGVGEAEILREYLKDNTDIKSLYYDKDLFEKEAKKENLFFAMEISVAIAIVAPLFLFIIDSYSKMVRMNFYELYLHSRNRKYIWRRSVRVSRLPLIGSGIIGLLMFIAGYNFLRTTLLIEVETYYLIPIEEMGLIGLVVTIFVLFLCFVVPIKEEVVDEK